MSKIVLCEGLFDQVILETLIKVNSLAITVRIYEGKNGLKGFMRTLMSQLDSGEITTLAVTRDADENGDGAFTSVRDTLKMMGFSNLPAQNGGFSGAAPKTGIFIVGPGGRGEMEDLCLASMQNRPEFSCVDEYFKCMKQAEPKAKARAWVWLAGSQTDFEFSVRKMGEKAYWNWDHPAFGPLKQFLRAM